MTHQTKTYRKFVATAATATLVASAVAPAASFAAENVKVTDVDGHRHQEAIETLVAEGVITGFPDNTFRPDVTIDRGSAAIMIARSLNLLDGKNIPANPFTDVSKDAKAYEAIVKLADKNIVSGFTKTQYKPDETVTRGQMAKIIALAFDLELGTGDDTPFSDVSSKVSTGKYISAIYNDKITEGYPNGKFGTEDGMKRGDFAKMTYTAMDNAGLIDQETPGEELVVESVSAINAKSLQVKFNKEVENTSDAKFEVKKGSIKVNTSEISWNDDNTVATLVLSGKLTAGEYTVNVKGVAEETLTGTVTAENEKVDAIELLSDVAPLNSGKTAVTVGYKVTNQYGEDITSTTQLSGNASGTVVTSPTAALNKGVATISVSNTTVKEGDNIVLTLVHQDSGVSTSKTVKVAAEAAVSEVEIKELYNKDGKTLNETTDLSKDAFYLIVEGKDQYGNKASLADLNGAGLLLNNTNASIVNVNGTGAFETIQVDGKDVTALRVTNPTAQSAAKAGSTNVMLISPASGKNATFKIDVAEAQRVDTITFEVPSVVAAKEALFIPVQATDKDGNAVTDEKVLKNATRGVSLSGLQGATFAVKDGVVGVSVPSTSNELQNTGYATLVGLTSTAKTTIANIKVEAEATPTIVTGLAKSASTTLLVNGTLKLSTANIVVEDQYGRTMTKAAFDAWLTGGNKVIVEDASAGAVALTATDSATQTDSETVTLNASSHTATVTGNGKGNEKVTITLVDAADGPIATSAKEVNFQVTDGTEYASYEVDEVGTVYDELGAGTSGITNNPAYDKTVEVYGVLSNGSKVKLTHGADYSVSSTNAQLNTDVSANGKLNVNGAYTYAQGQNEVKLPLTVTINATGEKLTQEVTISKVAPKVTKLDIVEEGDVSKVNMTSTSAIKYDANGGAFDFAKLAGAVDVVATDQYGTKVELTGSSDQFADGTAILSTLTFKKVDGNLVFASNGLQGASVIEIPTGSVFNVVVGAGDLESSALKVTTENSFSASGTVASELSDAKTAIEALTDSNFTAGNAIATADDSDAVETKVENVVNALSEVSGKGFTVTVTIKNFVAATGGSTDGSFDFAVKLEKAGQNVTTTDVTSITIPQ